MIGHMFDCKARVRAGATLLALAFGGFAPVVAQEVENGTLAAAIRASGHPCARVLEKEHQGGSVWLVRCNSGRFQVTLTDSSAAEVVPIDAGASP